MDLSIIRRRSRACAEDDGGFVVVHRPATIAHVEAWSAHEAAQGKTPLAEWLREGHAIAKATIRDLVLGWSELTVDGAAVTTERGIEIVSADWRLAREVVVAIVRTAHLDDLVGKG